MFLTLMSADSDIPWNIVSEINIRDAYSKNDENQVPFIIRAWDILSDF